MSLAQYRKKREFRKTPEPSGKSIKNTGLSRTQSDSVPLTFVIQKHEASQLHYDFRLELDGVLKSWAVPKGPSLNPEDKRLAMMVEDHPLEYASFEGIIPKGNYGAGTVMVWDQGVYIPYEAKDRKTAEKVLLELLQKGHLTFVMLGEKLKGEFALVKTPNAGENAWLLIKKGDEYASTKDVLHEDKSVLSGRSLEEISKQAEKKKEVWFSRPRKDKFILRGKPKSLDLGDAPKTQIPHMVKPMLAQTVDEPFDKQNWLFEMKWDGYRAIAEIDRSPSLRGVKQRSNLPVAMRLPRFTRNDNVVRLYSRNHQSYNEKFAPIAESLAKFPGTAVLDGEVVVVDKNGRPNFDWLQDYPKEKHGELRYYAFDLLYFDGHNLTKLPLARRKDLLKQLLPPLPNIAISDHIEETGIEFFKQTVQLHLEGIIAKNADSTYQEGVRSDNWLKIKAQKQQEAVIAGFTAPNGSRKHFGALILGVYKRGKLEYIGHTGGGFDERDLENVFDRLKPLTQDACPFKKRPQTNAPATWVKPILECDVAFSEWTKDHIMRHPIFIRLIDNHDYSSSEVEKLPVNNSRLSRRGGIVRTIKESETEVIIEKQKLTLSNLSKIFWPEPQEEYTKGDLVKYYQEIAPILLPHLVDRPQSLLRLPDGITGKSFFQKNASNLKDSWVKKTLITKEDKKIQYILCQDAATLIYLINLGCIDLNPWNSRIKHLEYPDYLIIDLDPEDTPFENVVKVALEFRKLFERLKIPSYPKTSGARGMHIYIPMGTAYSYEQTRQLAELFCYHVLSEIPDLTSMRRAPRERQGKVYLDYLQNARGQTLASAYSVRPQPGAPVSTPLKWEEVNSKLHPSQFTMKNIYKRVEKHGDLFKTVLGKGINLKNVLKRFE